MCASRKNIIAYEILPGCAHKVYDLCAEAGVTLTPCGATYPYGKDPEDKNIRIAPTFPTLEELSDATEILILSTKLVAIEKILHDRD